ncbi:MAG: serine acetyltransferase [Rhodothermales bacterium]|nr:serine acetyltransferase [Rhodothermales bacterium]
MDVVLGPSPRPPMLASARAELVADVCAARAAHPLPLTLRRDVEAWADALLALLFPHLTDRCSSEPEAVGQEFDTAHARLQRLLVADATVPADAPAPGTADAVMAALPDVRRLLLADATATFAGDPAARSVDEVILAYPGFLATALYRVAHELYVRHADLLARLLTEYGHRQTGIDLHPGATVGEAFAIDHGTGVVVGETAVIGDRVRLYQGVTLGALSVEKTLAGVQRHPTLEDDVVVYANATILGGETVVGAGSVIGGNVWLTESVAPGSVVTRTSTVRRDGAGRADPFADDRIDYYI